MPRSHRQSGSAIVDGLLILLLLLPSVLGSVLYGGVRLWVSGPLITLTFAVAGVMCLRFALRREGGQLRIPPGLIAILLMAIYATCMVSHAAAPGEVRLEVLKILSYASVYVALCHLGAATDRRWRVFVAVPIILVSLISWYAIVQHFNGSTMVLIEPRPEHYKMRASGTFFCPNHLAYLLSLVIVMGLGLAFNRRAGWVLRIVAGYGGLLALPVLLLTQSRSGWIGTAIGICVLVFMLAARKGVKRFLITAVFLPLALAAAGGGLWHFSHMFKSRVTAAIRGDVRVGIWTDTRDAILDEPVWGHGPGSYRWVYPHYKNTFRLHQQFPQYAHNEYLNVAFEYGAVGLAILGGGLLIALGRLLWLFWRIRAAEHARLVAVLLGCLAATSAHAFFDFNLHIYSAVQLLLVITAAILGVLYSRGELRSYRPSRAWRVPLGLTGVIFFTGLTLYMGRITASYFLVTRAEQLRTKELAVDAALVAANRAIALDPGSWRAYEELGRVQATRSAFYYDRDQRPEIAREAVAAYEEMLKLNPLNFDAHLELSHLYADQLDDPATSLKLLQEAIDYAPRHSEYRVQMGHRLRKMGYVKEALAVYTEARRHNPSDKVIQFNIRNLKKELGIK